MYESFFGFKEKPFSLLPDPGFLYPSKKHYMALTMLQYGLMNQAGITVITGEVGSGKTTLIRKLLSEIDDDISTGLISNTHESFGDLLQWVSMAFDLDYKGKDKVAL
ncbi:MAG TPA: general secretion pathway protein, partial [Gammaproteobacteria bacterium]|nr:general secretion pathway protein [Gammaproteobacteria bacterium]